MLFFYYSSLDKNGLVKKEIKNNKFQKASR